MPVPRPVRRLVAALALGLAPGAALAAGAPCSAPVQTLNDGDLLVTQFQSAGGGHVFRLDPTASPPVAPDCVATSAEFGAPRGLAVDRNGLLLVADNAPDTALQVKPLWRVDVTGSTTTSSGTLPGARAVSGSFSAVVATPRGTVVTSDGRMFTSDPNLTAAIPPLAAILGVDPLAGGSAGIVTQFGCLNFPNGLVVESESPELSLLVADSGRNPLSTETSGRPGRGIYRVLPDASGGSASGTCPTLDGQTLIPANQQVFCAAKAFGTPRSLARDPLDGSVYVTDSGDVTATHPVPPTIWRIPSTGCGANDALEVVAQGAPLVRPVGIDVADDGTLFVADATQNQVFRIAPGSHAPTLVSDAFPGCGSGCVPALFDLALYRRDPSPYFVADAGTDEILRVDPKTPARSTVASGGALAEPDGLSVLDATAGAVVVADTSAAAVIRAEGGAQVVQSQGGRLVRPTAVVPEASGTYLVTDLGNPSAAPPVAPAVIRVDPTTGSRTVVSEGGKLLRPVAAALDPAGFLVVADQGDPTAATPVAPRVVRISPDATAGAAGQKDLFAGAPLTKPTGIAFDPSDASILVADAGDAAAATPIPTRVLRLVVSATTLDTVSLVLSETNGGKLVSPAGIAVDVDHSLLVSDAGSAATGDGKVVRVDPTSGLQTLVPTGGPLDPALDRPTGIGIAPVAFDDTDGDGLVDTQDNCVLVANPSQTDTDGDFFGNACDFDYDNDGVVGASDFNKLRAAFGKTKDDPKFDPELDANDDGAIGATEFNAIRAAFGKPPGPSGV